MLRSIKCTVWVLALLMILPLAARAQEVLPYPAQGTAPPPPTSYSQEQLDQLTAPIALYPDPLVAQILMAATYPLEVVEAERWLQNPQNAQLQGDQMAAALAQQPWDPSVKSLVNFPQVLSMLDNNLQWTEQLGDAFLAQQPAVMDSVQRLRQMAQAAGHLASTSQQTVSADDGAIEIEPANPQVMYMPYYDPSVVYGAWPYPGYAPYYFPYPAGFYCNIFCFGAGIGMVDVLWGWDHWDWRNHHIDIDDRRFADINRGHAPASAVWEHDPAHRHGVPYASPAARTQFQGAADQARRNFRGFAPPAEGGGVSNPMRTNYIVRNSINAVQRTPTIVPENAQPTRQPMQHVQQQRQAPVFESFSRGPDVRVQSARGAYSRSTIPVAVRAAAPVRASGPHNSGGGGGGGHSQDTRTR